MVWGGRREEGSGWGTRVYLWQIHVDIWQNQYNIVELKNTIQQKKLRDKKKKNGENSHTENFLPLKTIKQTNKKKNSLKRSQTIGELKSCPGQFTQFLPWASCEPLLASITVSV